MKNRLIMFECYAIHSSNPEIKEALGYCVVGEGQLFEAKTLDEAKSLALMACPDAEIKENCGWILPHETEELKRIKSEHFIDGLLNEI